MLSLGAQRPYFACAWAVLALIGLRFIGSAALPVDRVFSPGAQPAMMVTVSVLLPPSILGSALLQVGMWYFWLGFDTTSSLKRILWFFLLYLVPPLATALYYWFVYRRSNVLEARAQLRGSDSVTG